MQVSDIVSLEEDRVYHDQIPGMDKYPSSRFMVVSSNEYCTGCISESNAGSKTAEAWSAGIGYQFATDKCVDLPSWFGSFTSQVEEEKTTRL